jgi:hypothetical protein
MFENCPADRIAFCQNIYSSNLSLHQKCLFISNHIPKFRPYWFDEEPKYFDDMIAFTYESALAKLEVEIATSINEVD